jgi:enamine deaminase RidA (YjgF/YER057c/UK114 family)
MQTAPQKIIRFDGADAAAGGTPRPFSKAVRAGDFIYVSGQVPTVDGEVVTGGSSHSQKLLWPILSPF